jgi:hypothetical protein
MSGRIDHFLGGIMDHVALARESLDWVAASKPLIYQMGGRPSISCRGV